MRLPGWAVNFDSSALEGIAFTLSWTTLTFWPRCSSGVESVIRILVADDFEAWRALVRRLLQPQSDWQIVAEASDGLEAVRKTIELRPDLAILDISMPLLNGLDACEKILESLPEAKVIFLSVNNYEEVMSAALAMGAEEYVLKANARRDLLPAISRCFTRAGFRS
jgi:DNA-binding NarL/FixJ family response regulator